MDITYTTHTLENGRLARSIPGVGTQDRPMSRAYQISDPNDISAKLAAGGYACEVLNPHMIKGRRSWNTVIQARDMGSERDGYINEAQIHCPHDGCHALAIQPGALRLFCYNQFKAAPVRIHHSSQDMREFLADPAQVLRDVLQHGRTMAERVEALHAVGDGKEMFHALWESKHGLWKAAIRFAPQYANQAGEYDFWTVLQSFTNTRKPGLLRLTVAALNDGWDDTQRGQVPAAWDKILNG